MTRRLNIVLAVALLFFALPYYWLLLDNRPGDAQPRPVSIGQLRALAQAIPGERPVEIAVERSAFNLVPGNFLAAGTGMKRRLYSIVSYRLEVPGRGPVVIDPGPMPADADRLGLRPSNRAAQRRIRATLDRASLMLATSGSPAATGSLRARAAGLPQASILLLPTQLADLKLARRIPGDRPSAIAPGIVAIPTGAPTPGSQMIYIRLADGREYLLAGEVAPLSASYRQMRGRPRLFTDHARPENRQDAFAWLATIRELQRQAPDLRVLPGHDLAWLASRERRDWLARRFPDS